jgi:RNA polymerase sigma-70 factor (ECF subfamily)
VVHDGRGGVNGSEDNELVRKVLAGETKAFRGLVERHQSRVFYLGLRFLRNPEEAEDFAQDVFVRAYERLRSFSGHVPFSAWLYRVAFNLAVNRYHMRSRHPRQVPVDRAGVTAPTSGPEAEVLDEELTEVLKQKLGELPRLYQIVLKMRFFEGFPYRGMARALQVPVNTAKSYVHRAKGILKTKLRPYLEGAGGTS